MRNSIGLNPVFRTSKVEVKESETPIGYMKRENNVEQYFSDERGTILHRTDGPAYIDHSTGIEIWYRNGEKHRDGDQPAFTSPTMYQWYVDGKRHRENGPAVKHRDSGYMAYYVNDRLHRVGGPAVIYDNGDKAYYYDGVFIVGITENGSDDYGASVDSLHEWRIYRDLLNATNTENLQNADEMEPAV